MDGQQKKRVTYDVITDMVESWADANGGQASVDGQEGFAMCLVELERNHLLYTLKLNKLLIRTCTVD